MKRRIAMLVGSFAALALAFVGYWLVTEYRVVPPAPTGDGNGGSEKRPHPPGPVLLAPRDKEGRLEGVYKAESWDKVDDYTYNLTKPEVTLYRKDGQTVHIRSDAGTIVLYAREGPAAEARSDEGTVVAYESGRKRPRLVSLRGNVQIDLDRGTGPDLPPVSERPRDHVRLLMDQVEFDNDMLTVRSDSEIELYSQEADVFGRGLLIRWREEPSELVELRIERGRKIVVKEVPEGFDVISPTGTTAERPAEPEQPAGAAPAAEEPEPAAGVAAAEKPSGAAGRDAKAEEQAPTKNIYVARFHDNVRVVSGDRTVRGADSLELRYEWDASFRPLKKESPRAAATSRPAEAPAEKRAGAEPPAGEPVAEKPTTAPAPGTMVIEWDGPLVLRPVGHTDKPSQKRYSVKAAGEELVVEDPQAKATCKSLVFSSDEGPAGEAVRESQLLGTEAEPVRLAMADGATVVCREVRFDHQSGKAYLSGPGRMTGAAERPRTAGESATSAPASTTRPAEPDRITWRESVEATFEEITTKRKDGEVRTSRFIKHAVFCGKVELNAGKTGDFVRCEKLDVDMSRSAAGKTYPAKAVATGNVLARQEGSDIRADELTVRFKETERRSDSQKRRKEKDKEKDKYKVQPSVLEARGNVKVTDRRGEQVMTAEADRLKSDLINRSATLHGAPAADGKEHKDARISQGPNSISGREIRVYEITDDEGKKDVVVIVGSAGRLTFLTDRDLDSQKLKDKREITIAWSERMSYRGPRNLAEFSGDVKLDSGTDHMACRVMRVWFDKAKEPTTKPSKARAEKAESNGGGSERALALGVEQYSKRSIRQMQAEDDVVLWRRQEDDEGRLLRRQQLRTEKLDYFVQYERLTCHGYGRMVVEDYRPPKETTDRGEEAILGLRARADRPSTTAMEWQNGMEYMQQRREVVMDGGVAMVHRSGNEVTGAGLKVPQWGELKKGRATAMRCEKLMVRFDEPKEDKVKDKPGDKDKDKDTGGDEPTLRLGDVKSFSATRGVRIKDGPKKTSGPQVGVSAQRVVYAKDPDTVVIWGFLQGRPPADAELTYEDLSANRHQTFRSPKIIWFRKNDQIIVEDVRGGGGR